MNVAIYSRKSVYTGKGESIENQIEMCKQYIRANMQSAPEIELFVFEDEGFSAKNMDRPQFQKMLREIRQKKFRCLVCYRLDRISRSVGDFAKLIEELGELGVDFISIKEKFDTGSPMGKAMMMITSVFAQLERETLAERVRDNMFMLARAGRWLGGTPPTGFVSEKTEKVDVDGRTKTACQLKFDPGEIETVKVIFQIFLELQSVSGVYKHLIARGVKSRTGICFSKLGLKQILENPVYCIADEDARDYFVAKNADVCFRESDCSGELGLLAYHKRDYQKKSAPRLEVSEWIIAIGKHKGIVAGKQWVTVQRILAGNKAGGSDRNAYNDYCLLSGKILCGKCGRRMFSRLRRSKGAGGLFDYICDGKLQGGTTVCDSQNLNGRQTDDLVCGYLMEYADGGVTVCALLEKLRADVKGKGKGCVLAETDLRIARCKSEMRSLVRKLSEPDVGRAFVMQVNGRIEELSSELERLADEKKRADERQGLGDDGALQLDSIAGRLCSLKSAFGEMSMAEKRMLVKLLIQKIEWDGQDLHVYMYGE